MGVRPFLLTEHRARSRKIRRVKFRRKFTRRFLRPLDLTAAPWARYNRKGRAHREGYHRRNSYISRADLSAVSRFLTDRDALITAVLADTGFRIDDVMHTRVWQWLGETITLIERKTGKARTVRLACDARERLKAAFAGAHPFRYAFPALRRVSGGRGKMHRSTYWRHFVAAVKRAGFGGRGITPHSLRKLYAVELLQKCGSLAAVMRDLNHSKAEITMIYAFADKVCLD